MPDFCRRTIIVFFCDLCLRSAGFQDFAGISRDWSFLKRARVSVGRTIASGPLQLTIAMVSEI